MPPATLQDFLAGKRVIICAGPGGVGKTTTAASLGVLAARMGRATLVATIDPAPRLVDALALPELGPVPASIPSPVAERLAIVDRRHLEAARIDPRHTFDELVHRFLPDQAARRRILDNTIYRQITTTLTGAQEYAATLALHGFTQDAKRALVVLDTPPAGNAMEFFDAPTRISAAIESPVLKWLLAERGARKGGFFSLRRLSSGGALVLRRMAQLVGSRFLDDLSVFLADFEPVLDGFVQCTREIDVLLHGADVAVVLVCAPDPPGVDEALAFAVRLRDIGLAPSAFIVNRLVPAPGLRARDAIRDELSRAPGLAALGDATLDEAADVLHRAATALAPVAHRQEQEVARLAAAHPDCPIVRVPLVETGADNLATLAATAAHLADGLRA